MYQILKENLEKVKLEGWSNFNDCYNSSSFFCKISKNENWIIDIDVFENKYRIIPNKPEVEHLFLNIEDIFSKNTSDNLEDILYLYRQITKNELF